MTENFGGMGLGDGMAWPPIVHSSTAHVTADPEPETPKVKISFS